MKRRKFIHKSAYATLGLSAMGLGSCTKKGNAVESAVTETNQANMRTFPISLAQWSLNKYYKSGELDPMNFAQHAASYGVTGIEYVNQLYEPLYLEASNQKQVIEKMVKELKTNAEDAGMTNVLIMVDHEGDLAVADKAARIRAIANHQKWVDAANYLGCHSIRVNVFGEGSREEQAERSKESLMSLSEYAKDLNVNVIVENHGGYSSDPKWMIDVIKEVNMANCGLLPDFGNWCIAREGGERWGAKCIEETTEIYDAVRDMMPYAKGVSAKSYSFDASGNEERIDYQRMMEVVSASDYEGFVGVEYEGEVDAKIGIPATKKLLERCMKG